jgi:hypothetical protein
MANLYTPFGFRQFGHRDGMPPTGGLQRMFINSSDTNLYFTGDLVSLSSLGGGGYVISPSSGGSPTTPSPQAGVFNGCEYYNSNVGRMVWAAWFPGNLNGFSTTNGFAIAYMQSDPEMQYIGQCSTTNTITSSYIGQNIGVSLAQSTLGNQTTGQSKMCLASSITGAVSSLPFQIVDFYSNFVAGAGPQLSSPSTGASGINGTDDTSAGNILVVAPNSWQRRAGVTGTTS